MVISRFGYLATDRERLDRDPLRLAQLDGSFRVRFTHTSI